MSDDWYNPYFWKLKEDNALDCSREKVHGTPKPWHLASPCVWGTYMPVVIPALRFIWILIIAENWKHCSKIIFKYVNSIVGPSFENKFVELDNLWVPWTVHETHCIGCKCVEIEFQRNPSGGSIMKEINRLILLLIIVSIDEPRKSHCPERPLDDQQVIKVHLIRLLLLNGWIKRTWSLEGN